MQLTPRSAGEVLPAADPATPVAGAPRPVVLVVDDERINRTLIAGILKASFDVIQADSGAEAVAMATRAPVDVVVMDIHMPGMDGFEATQRIKELAGDRFLPVIMMTAGNDEKLLGQGLARGADDFLIKPVSRVLLQEKIRALLRVSGVFRSLHDQNAELTIRRARAERDYDVARRVFERAARRSRFDLPGLIVQAMSLEQFNGDFVLSVVTGHKLRLLVGDFAGHGLSAAVGVLPASEVFYEMTEANKGLEELVRELSAKLHRTFPRDLFLSACVVDIDLAHERISIWNGGLPDALIFGADGLLTQRLSSHNLPVGILPPQDVDTTPADAPFPLGARLAIFSDGLLESRSPDGELFGTERLERALTGCDPRGDWTIEMWESHRRFCGGMASEDDVTFVGLAHTSALAEVLLASAPWDAGAIEPPLETSLSFRFFPESLRSPDPLAPVRRFVAASPLLAPRAAELQTIITELFANAVEHGLLGLDSAIKERTDGFQEYYRLKESRLLQLEAGAVTVGIEIRECDHHPQVIITVSDTGPGFLHVEVQACAPDAKAGRGLLLVKELTRELTFLDHGRSIEAVFELASADRAIVSE